ncbi:hypothetical protein RND71_008788 [Anisodus tanguticus]|uniref:Oberon-like PHD finger domain-containing protein n=1 Tax=Anisodus tanguticus TaxID=243964 RepID=A0AAE1VU26_9SOLA|nr:hypothetical protein RND71_008788 [Anisodus tanguticus]
MEKNMDSIDEHRFGKFQEKGVHFLEESALQMKTSYDDFSMADFRTRKAETCGCQDLLNSSEKIVSYKGKEIVVFEDHNEESNIVEDLPDEVVESTTEYLRSLIASPYKKDLLVSLQNRLTRRSDLTVETLSKCNKTQLEILVAIKMSLGSFLSFKNYLQATELMEIFAYERCRNINCKRVLHVDNCKCKICSRNKGFCNVCMCQVCLNLDYANGTCSWVGCDRCVHWCHVVCAIQRNIIKPGPSINRPSGTTEMQFHCLGCGHASEMFRFAKEMYRCCAKNWGQEILIKELDYVSKIFHGSEDFKGKELHGILILGRLRLLRLLKSLNFSSLIIAETIKPVIPWIK